MHWDPGVDEVVVVVNLMGVPTLARKMLTIWFELPSSFSTHPFILTITPGHPLSPQFGGLVQYFIWNNLLEGLDTKEACSKHFLSVMISLSQTKHRCVCSEEAVAEILIICSFAQRLVPPDIEWHVSCRRLKVNNRQEKYQSKQSNYNGSLHYVCVSCKVFRFQHMTHVDRHLTLRFKRPE